MTRNELIHYIMKLATRLSHEEEITKGHAVDVIDRWYRPADYQESEWDEATKLLFKYYNHGAQ